MTENNEHHIARYSSLIKRDCSVINYNLPNGNNKRVFFHSISQGRILDLPENFSQDWIYYFADCLKGPFIVESVKELRRRYEKIKIISSFYSERFTVNPLVLSKALAIKEQVDELKKIPIYLMNGSFGRVAEQDRVTFCDQDAKNRDLAIKISMDYILAPPSGKLYILCAPSGFGKSSLQDRMSLLCTKSLPKITTRPFRSIQEIIEGNIKWVNPNMFKELVKNKGMLAPHIYDNNAYGLAIDDFQEVFSDKYDAYLWDTCEPEAALSLKERYPDIVKVIGIFPKFSFAGLGLEKRIANLSLTFNDLRINPADVMKKQRIITNTRQRLEKIMREVKKYQQFLPKFDKVLEGETLDDNISLMIDVMIEDKK